MSRTPSGVDLPRARSEDEAQRVGAERGREQRVVFVGDAADLDEHQPARRPTTGAGELARAARPDRRARTSASPTSTASNPAAAIRAASVAAAHRALGDRDHIGRELRRERLGDTEILGERREVAAVDADARARRRRARARPRAASCASTSTPSPRSDRRARGDRRAARRPGSRPTISRIASAPIARASYTCTSSIVKSLRSTGNSVFSRAICRSATEPPKYGASVRTDSAAAPPCFVRLGRRGRIEVEGERALRRRAALDLRDHRDVPVGAAQRRAERHASAARRARAGAAGRGSAAAGAP